VSEIKLGNYGDKDLAYPRFIRNHLDFGLENSPFSPWLVPLYIQAVQ